MKANYFPDKKGGQDKKQTNKQKRRLMRSQRFICSNWQWGWQATDFNRCLHWGENFTLRKCQWRQWRLRTVNFRFNTGLCIYWKAHNITYSFKVICPEINAWRGKILQCRSKLKTTPVLQNELDRGRVSVALGLSCLPWNSLFLFASLLLNVAYDKWWQILKMVLIKS